MLSCTLQLCIASLLTNFTQPLGPAQADNSIYTHSNLSGIQSCALLLKPIFSLFSHLNSALHNLVIEFCSALKTIHFLRLFSRFAHNVLAIELLNFK